MVASGLPRMRGDRPQVHQCGSTAWPGSPACAGIDLSGLILYKRVTGLPRMRGDRPRSGAGSTTGRWAPPHARGSTPATTASIASSSGSPACAGIDLLSDAHPHVSVGLPRMRGDRPVVTVTYRDKDTAPPHARGSTRGGHVHSEPDGGSPACAGIDPLDLPGPPPPTWLPRMRGDRPPSWTSFEHGQAAPPHARGSTASRYLTWSTSAGSPACAGIDLNMHLWGRLEGGLPRMRGDRPPSWTSFEHGQAAPPHARGSTRHDRIQEPLRGGSPACAGIDPCP